MDKRPYKSYTKTPKENKVNKIVGLNIRDQRIKHKWTQTQLAEKLGVSFQQVGKYEKGQNGLSAIRLLEISKQFNVPYDVILPDNIYKESDAEIIMKLPKGN
jgi:transcriptional regulator with XRE-family HTH domain